MTRRKDGPVYHIDYVFAPSNWLDGADIELGGYDKWIGSGLSDHAPLLCTFPRERLT